MNQSTKTLLLIIGLIALLALPALLTGCTSAPHHPGRATFERACARCHNISKPLAKTKTREGWQRTVKVMKKRGARLTDEEAKLVMDYLVTVRGVDKAGIDK